MYVGTLSASSGLPHANRISVLPVSTEHKNLYFHLHGYVKFVVIIGIECSKGSPGNILKAESHKNSFVPQGTITLSRYNTVDVIVNAVLFFG